MQISVELRWLCDADTKPSLFENLRDTSKLAEWRHLDPWPVSIGIKEPQKPHANSVTEFRYNLGERDFIAFLLAHTAGDMSGDKGKYPSLCSGLKNLTRMKDTSRYPQWLLNLFRQATDGQQPKSQISKLLSLNKNGDAKINCDFELNISVDGIDRSGLSAEGKRILADAVSLSCRLYWAHAKKSSRTQGGLEVNATDNQLRTWITELRKCNRSWTLLTKSMPQSGFMSGLHKLSLKVSDSCFIGKSPITEDAFTAFKELRNSELGQFRISKQSGKPKRGSYSCFQELFDDVNRKIQAEYGEELWRLMFPTKDELLNARSLLKDKSGEEWCESNSETLTTAPVVPMTGTGGSTHCHKSGEKQCRWVLRRIAREQT